MIYFSAKISITAKIKMPRIDNNLLYSSQNLINDYYVIIDYLKQNNTLR